MKRVLAALILLGISATAALAQITLTPDAQTLPPPLPPPGAPSPVAEPRPVAAPSAASVPLPRLRPEPPLAVAGAEGETVVDGAGLSLPEPLPIEGDADVPGLPALPAPSGEADGSPTLSFEDSPPALPGEAVAGSPDTSVPPLPDFGAAEPAPALPLTAAAEEKTASEVGLLPDIAPPPPPPGGPDLAYGAFQRGFYLTAFSIAIERAEAGDVPAQTLIALIYEGGYGVPQDFAKAVEWYRLAADAGDREAQFALGMLYMQGRGAAQNRALGADYIEKAANQGQVDAMYNLGLLLMEGSLRPSDPRRAAQLLAAAAESGSPDAQYALAQLYAVGIGVRKDESLAVQWFASAARMGIVPAQVDYAIRLFNGIGVARDEAAAAAWFERAAEAGDPIAQNRLARILAIGAGTQADPVAAAKWHYLAVTQGKQDDWLETFVGGLSDTQRLAAADAAQRWPGN